jgi:hypothetical protein
MCWTPAEQAGNATPYGLQHLLSRARWDADAVRDDICGFVVERLGHEDGRTHTFAFGRQLDVRTIRTAWDLDARPELADLRLRAWAHMPGFRSHFSTKSRRYSTTLGALRDARADWRSTFGRKAREIVGLPKGFRFCNLGTPGTLCRPARVPR